MWAPPPATETPHLGGTPIPAQWLDQITALIDDPPDVLGLDQSRWSGRSGSVWPATPADVRRRLSEWHKIHDTLTVGRGSGPTLLCQFSLASPLAMMVIDKHPPPVEAHQALVELVRSLDPTPPQASMSLAGRADAWESGSSDWRDHTGTFQFYGGSTGAALQGRCVSVPTWWTMLGPGHAQRLTDAGATEVLDQLEPLETVTGARRWSLTIGEYADWTPDHIGRGRRELDEPGRLIAPLLPTPADRQVEEQARVERHRAAGW